LSPRRGKDHGPSPVRSVKVQGVTLNPGDDVLVLIRDEWILRSFSGSSKDGGAWMKVEEHTTCIDQLPGPFPLDRLRHVNLLGGFIREIDAD